MLMEIWLCFTGDEGQVNAQAVGPPSDSLASHRARPVSCGERLL